MTQDNDPSWADGWFEEFERQTDDKLGDGSACKQIHPVVEHWFEEWIEEESPTPRKSIEQAIACLATEVIVHSPSEIWDMLIEHCDEDEIADWVQGILVVGQAFQKALDSGQLDDL